MPACCRHSSRHCRDPSPNAAIAAHLLEPFFACCNHVGGLDHAQRAVHAGLRQRDRSRHPAAACGGWRRAAAAHRRGRRRQRRAGKRRPGVARNERAESHVINPDPAFVRSPDSSLGNQCVCSGQASTPLAGRSHVDYVTQGRAQKAAPPLHKACSYATSVVCNATSEATP